MSLVVVVMMRILIFLIFIFSSCSISRGQKEFCYHDCRDAEYSLIILTDAKHLNYSNFHSLLRTIAKHPLDGSKEGDVGHAWICLKGKDFFLEGGHSGELGISRAKYCEGIMNYIESGNEQNPIKYLWETLPDGFFQQGPGKHQPTFAVKLSLSEEQFQKILRYIKSYDFSQYSLVNCQCTTFAAQVAMLAGLDLECEVTIPIPRVLQIFGMRYCLWCDSNYSQITIATPDILEKSLKKAVREGKAQKVLR